MQKSTSPIPVRPSLEALPPTQDGIPPTKAHRDGLLTAVQQYVRAVAPTPPLSLEELTLHSERLLGASGAEPAWRPFLAVLLHNEVWRETLAGVPYCRRLLLLPQCLRDADACAGRMDEIGLLCGRCGRCVIQELQAAAERLGYVVLVAEGSPVVMSLLEGRRVEAVVGVSCLSVLERVFPYMQAAAVPGIAVPLLHDGCHNTAVDLDWVWEAIHLTSDDKTRRLDLDALRADVESWFSPSALEEVLGPAETETEALARTWLARAGKRWRPFLAVCAYKALRDDPAAEPSDDLRKLAVAVECFHKASLIHDDIEDHDEARYEQKTLHAEHGVPVALNVGDLLLGEGYRLIAECGAPGGRKVEMLRTAAEGHRTLCIGQGAELCWARRGGVLSIRDVLEIFRRKTAPAFDVALQLGATCAGAGENVREALSDYSQALGVAYQIRDDLDDFEDGPDGSDAQAARPSILLAVATEGAQGAARQRLEEVWQRKAAFRDLPDDVRRLFDEAGVVGRSRGLLEHYKQQAIRALNGLDNANLKGLLRRVIWRIFNDDQVLFCCHDYQSGDAPGGAASHEAPG